jgi:hypothetical protein
VVVVVVVVVAAAVAVAVAVAAAVAVAVAVAVIIMKTFFTNSFERTHLNDMLISHEALNKGQQYKLNIFKVSKYITVNTYMRLINLYASMCDTITLTQV